MAMEMETIDFLRDDKEVAKAVEALKDAVFSSDAICEMYACGEDEEWEARFVELVYELSAAYLDGAWESWTNELASVLKGIAQWTDAELVQLVKARFVEMFDESLDVDEAYDQPYNISVAQGPYGMGNIVVFCLGDDPNDIQVIGVVYKGKVTRIMWDADGWEEIDFVDSSVPA